VTPDAFYVFELAERGLLASRALGAIQMVDPGTGDCGSAALTAKRFVMLLAPRTTRRTS
jgi:hypothetical protein